MFKGFGEIWAGAEELLVWELVGVWSENRGGVGDGGPGMPEGSVCCLLRHEPGVLGDGFGGVEDFWHGGGG